MYERSYGEKYDKNRSTVQIAKLVRAEIEAARKSGHLPAGKYSVRSSSYSMGSSITVTLKLLGDVYTPGYLRDTNYTQGPCEIVDGHVVRPSMYLPHVMAAMAKVEAMLAAYNHDGSDSSVDYFDVKFYSHVTVEADYGTAREAFLTAQDYAGEAAMMRSEEETTTFTGIMVPKSMPVAQAQALAAEVGQVMMAKVIPFTAPVKPSEEPAQVRFMRESGLL